ncbi:electron transport complex, RnfABCDGE type, B subunit [Alkalispirochaeta americana]|uniref:Ion-translocating oxidoreductase complex subunit B n=2 Tax=Alkalispirochaeta americana TaxID=159291 RepID=A0A1N6N4J4_9SPIO|nr:electron transport complex, RnfABCDGE type, B subunit [Alkalispirochaeta americana]
MSQMILFSVLTLGAVAALFATILYVISRVFAVEEDPRVAEVAEMLPGVNCGACGFPGCPGMAEALVAAADTGDISHMTCPPGGAETMSRIGSYFGLEVGAVKASVAVLRCGGTRECAPPKTAYDGPRSCVIAHSTFSGESGCPFGCLGYGDCDVVCPFDAITMNAETGLPEVDQELCTSCGACVKACPRSLFQIRPVGRRDRRVWINCRNREPALVAKKNCSVACIGCGKCKKVCDTVVQAITVENSLAFIDSDKCIACGKCVAVCPTKAIAATFDPPKPKPKKAETEPSST